MTAVASPFLSRVGVLFLVPVRIERAHRSHDVVVSAVLRECDLYACAGHLPGPEVYEFMAMRDDHGRMANRSLVRGAHIGVPLKE